jgi:hypothetical protein
VEEEVASGVESSRRAIAGHVTRGLLEELHPVTAGRVPLAPREQDELRRRYEALEQRFGTDTNHEDEED